MTSLLRLQRLAKGPSLSFVRGMGSYATFKVPTINNEPNVSIYIHGHDLDPANKDRKHMRLGLQTGRLFRMLWPSTSRTLP